ncbi:MAG: hypothetical protein V3U19_08205 [Thermodesulfobacteriota bacterium]
MRRISKIVGFGFLTWLIPFVTSCFLYSGEGEPLIDIFLVKTIMIVLFSIMGALLLILYFKGIAGNYLKEGIIVGLVWLVINWVLDLVVLVPISKMGIATYFAQIGLRYLMIPTMSIAMGYLVEIKRKGETKE